MNQRHDRRAFLITTAEVLIFFFAVYWGRHNLEVVLANYQLPSLLLFAIRLVALLMFVALAFWVDRQIFAYFKNRERS